MQDTPALLARLERLERRSRGLERAVIILSILLTGAAALGAARPRDRIVTAERFVLIDDEGAERGALALDSKGYPNLLLRKDRASAILTVNGPGLSLRGEDGKRGAWIGVDPKGTAGVSLYGERLTDGVRLTAKPDGSSGVYLLNAEGRERVSMEHLADGTASVSARNEQGLPRAFFGMAPGELPSLILLDRRGVRRIGMLVQPDDAPLLALEDATGRPRFELSQRFDGSTHLRLFSEDGDTAFQAP